jgi:parallel beta-helix repeat protein
MENSLCAHPGSRKCNLNTFNTQKIDFSVTTLSNKFTHHNSMKTHLRLLCMLLAWMILSPGKLQAQNEGTAFSCDGTFYQIRQVGTTSSLFRVNRSAAAYTTTAINVRTVGGVPTNDLGVLLNGLSYNPQDGYLYAVSTTGTSGTVPAANTIRLYKIGQGGIQDLGVTNLPAIQVASGTVDKNGFYYVSSQNSAGTANYNLYRFNLGAATPAARLTATALPFRNSTNTANLNITFYDLALNPADNILYGVFNNGTLWRINANGTSTNAPVTVIDNTQTNTDPVGTSFFDVAGNMFVYTNGTVGNANSGGFYQVNLTTGVYTLISNIDPASVSDGASCINPDQRIDIVKEVTSITRVNATTFDVGFSIRVKNTSTATDANVQVNDFLWSGSATTQRANTTFSSLANQLASSVTLRTGPTVAADPTNVNPVFNLAINSGYTGVGGAAGTTTGALLTGNQPLTAGQAAIITFTVRVAFGTANPNNVPPSVTNTAYASSTTTTNPTGYAQQNAAGGFISAPGQLVATDRSTDGPSLPIIANDDTPTPTPVSFSPSISGTVFEDINYGGGVGRSQATSSGIGVEGVRVELYTAGANGTFLTFTTTDAAGNYSFNSIDGGATPIAAATSYQVRVVNSTVASNRPNPSAATGLVGVQTYIFGATTQNQIGGANPNKIDLAANAGTVTGGGGQTLNQLRATNATGGEIQSITTVTTPANVATVSPAVLGVDFGFNFSTVVNTNDTGAGSLRQFILNSNALTNDNLSQKSSVSGVTLLDGYEYAIFMLNDGTTVANGLRAGTTATVVPGGYNATTGFTFTPTTALPNITDESTAIDGSLQAALTGNKVAASTTAGSQTTGPEVTVNFNSLKGLYVTGASTRIASVGLNNAKGTVNTTTATASIVFSDGAGVTINGAAAAGTVVTDVTALNNAIAGIRLDGGATDVTVNSNVTRSATATTNNGTVYDADGINLVNASGNTISDNITSNNVGWGILLAGAAGNENNVVSGNTINNNGTGASSDDGGVGILFGQNNTFSANTINSNAGDGIVAMTGTSANLFTKNSFSGNTDLGIDLSATTTATGDAVSVNANGKTTASGANSLLNFPVLTQAVITSTVNGNLQITGFAPAGSTIEFFLSDKTTDGFGQGRTYLFSTTEGASMAATANGTSAAIADTDTRSGSYSGTINGFNQGAETGATRFAYLIPLSSLTATQRTALTTGGARLTATATTAGTTTSEFSGNILIAQNRTLPVELKAFEVAASNANALLTWSTASEQNNDHFVVERSFDGGRFERIGQVRGQGTTSQTTNYRFTDANVGTQRTGVVYYRLQQVDTDGTASYSPVRTVQFAPGTTAGTPAVGVYPNPATSQDLTVTLVLTTLPAGSYEVRVLDATGRVVRAQSAQGGQEQLLPVQQLPAGVYLVQVQGQGLNLTQRFSKQ